MAAEGGKGQPITQGQSNFVFSLKVLRKTGSPQKNKIKFKKKNQAPLRILHPVASLSSPLKDTGNKLPLGVLKVKIITTSKVL